MLTYYENHNVLSPELHLMLSEELDPYDVGEDAYIAIRQQLDQEFAGSMFDLQTISNMRARIHDLLNEMRRG